jgi:hypothetical protein
MSDSSSSDVGLLPRSVTRRILTVTLLLAALTFLPSPTQAQGCTQCRDTTAATSPATQLAYRHAIILMSTTAAVFFLATLVIMKRNH